MSPETYRIVLIANTAATWWMTGIVWFCAIVQYPMFANVGNADFVQYHAEHVRRTQRVVLVPMLVELVLTFWIAAAGTTGSGVDGLDLAGALFVLLVWLCTFFRQVPDHDRLSTGFDFEVHRRLVRGNLVRCVIWSGHALVTAMQCHRAMT